MMDECYEFECERNEHNHDHSMHVSCEDFRRTDFPLAMAYVPWQTLGEVYPETKALQQGTLFPELDKPFLGAK